MWLAYPPAEAADHPPNPHKVGCEGVRRRAKFVFYFHSLGTRSPSMKSRVFLPMLLAVGLAYAVMATDAKAGCCAPEPACGAAVDCCCQPAPCCRPRLLDRLRARLCRPRCCEPVCCEPVCEPTCCAPEPTCCAPEPACGCPDPCCEPACCEPCCGRPGLLARLRAHLCRPRCCAPVCCEPVCGSAVPTCCGG